MARGCEDGGSGNQSQCPFSHLDGRQGTPSMPHITLRGQGLHSLYHSVWPVQVHRAPCLLKYSDTAVLKFLIFHKGAVHFHFVLGSTNYVASPAHRILHCYSVSESQEREAHLCPGGNMSPREDTEKPVKLQQGMYPAHSCSISTSNKKALTRTRDSRTQSLW